jgi:predicted transcriptional regulator
MAMTKITMTLDDATVQLLNRTAKRLGKAKSEVARQAIMEFAAHSDRLSPREIQRRLAILDELAQRAPTRPQQEVDAELADIRESRRAGWRGHEDRNR